MSHRLKNNLTPEPTDDLWSAPMSGISSIRRALALRSEDLSYRHISIVMRLYHGDDRTKEAWRSVLRAHGADPRHYRNSQRVPPRVKA